MPSSAWKSTRLNSSHLVISYAVFCLKQHALRHRASETLVLLWLAQEVDHLLQVRLHLVDARDIGERDRRLLGVVKASPALAEAAEDSSGASRSRATR